MSKTEKILIIAVLAVLIPALSWADSYCPKQGEEFVFYPVSKVYKQVLKGFDCFYVPELAFKDGETRPEKAYRFKVDAHGVTPFDEIEGHTFVLERALKEHADRPVAQQSFLCFLVRDDGEHLLLRIPFVRQSTDNTLTRGMTVILTAKNSFRQGSSLSLINIPACPVRQLEKLATQMTGQTLTRQAGRDMDMTVSTLVKYLNKDFGDEIIRSTSLYCDSVVFADVKGYVFRQPIAFGHLNGRKAQLPVFDFRGNGESVYGSYFSINTIFRFPDEDKPSKVEVAASETPSSYVVEEPASVTSLWVVEEKPKDLAVENKVEAKIVEVPDQPVIVKPEGPDPAILERLAKERLADLTKRYGAKNAKIIMDGKVSVGFTQEMCREALGDPDYINTTQNMYTILEQWVYGHDLYLYFQKGKLRTIDEF